MPLESPAYAMQMSGHPAAQLSAEQHERVTQVPRQQRWTGRQLNATVAMLEPAALMSSAPDAVRRRAANPLSIEEGPFRDADLEPAMEPQTTARPTAITWQHNSHASTRNTPQRRRKVPQQLAADDVKVTGGEDPALPEERSKQLSPRFQPRPPAQFDESNDARRFGHLDGSPSGKGGTPVADRVASKVRQHLEQLLSSVGSFRQTADDAIATLEELQPDERQIIKARMIQKSLLGKSSLSQLQQTSEASGAIEALEDALHSMLQACGMEPRSVNLESFPSDLTSSKGQTVASGGERSLDALRIDITAASDSSYHLEKEKSSVPSTAGAASFASPKPVFPSTPTLATAAAAVLERLQVPGVASNVANALGATNSALTPSAPPRSRRRSSYAIESIHRNEEASKGDSEGTAGEMLDLLDAQTQLQNILTFTRQQHIDGILRSVSSREAMTNTFAAIRNASKSAVLSLHNAAETHLRNTSLMKEMQGQMLKARSVAALVHRGASTPRSHVAHDATTKSLLTPTASAYNESEFLLLVALDRPRSLDIELTVPQANAVRNAVKRMLFAMVQRTPTGRIVRSDDYLGNAFLLSFRTAEEAVSFERCVQRNAMHLPWREIMLLHHDPEAMPVESVGPIIGAPGGGKKSRQAILTAKQPVSSAGALPPTMKEIDEGDLAATRAEALPLIPGSWGPSSLSSSAPGSPGVMSDDAQSDEDLEDGSGSDGEGRGSKKSRALKLSSTMKREHKKVLDMVTSIEEAFANHVMEQKHDVRRGIDDDKKRNAKPLGEQPAAQKPQSSKKERKRTNSGESFLISLGSSAGFGTLDASGLIGASTPMVHSESEDDDDEEWAAIMRLMGSDALPDDGPQTQAADKILCEGKALGRKWLTRGPMLRTALHYGNAAKALEKERYAPNQLVSVVSLLTARCKGGYSVISAAAMRKAESCLQLMGGNVTTVVNNVADADTDNAARILFKQCGQRLHYELRWDSLRARYEYLDEVARRTEAEETMSPPLASSPVPSVGNPRGGLKRGASVKKKPGQPLLDSLRQETANSTKSIEKRRQRSEYNPNWWMADVWCEWNTPPQPQSTASDEPRPAAQALMLLTPSCLGPEVTSHGTQTSVDELNNASQLSKAQSNARLLGHEKSYRRQSVAISSASTNHSKSPLVRPPNSDKDRVPERSFLSLSTATEEKQDTAAVSPPPTVVIVSNDSCNEEKSTTQSNKKKDSTSSNKEPTSVPSSSPPQGDKRKASSSQRKSVGSVKRGESMFVLPKPPSCEVASQTGSMSAPPFHHITKYMLQTCQWFYAWVDGAMDDDELLVHLYDSLQLRKPTAVDVVEGSVEQQPLQWSTLIRHYEEVMETFSKTYFGENELVVRAAVAGHFAAAHDMKTELALHRRKRSVSDHPAATHTEGRNAESGGPQPNVKTWLNAKQAVINNPTAAMSKSPVVMTAASGSSSGSRTPALATTPSSSERTAVAALTALSSSGGFEPRGQSVTSKPTTSSHHLGVNDSTDSRRSSALPDDFEPEINATFLPTPF